MLDIYDELKALTARLTKDGIPYALCGGLAMAIHSVPRSTIDIDLLIPQSALDETLSVAHRLGYTIHAVPMTFADGVIDIRRVSKLDPESGDILSLDVLLVTPPLSKVWDTRSEVEWAEGRLWVVSREGLIFLKSLRKSGQDLDDIRRLEETEDEG